MHLLNYFVIYFRTGFSARVCPCNPPYPTSKSKATEAEGRGSDFAMGDAGAEEPPFPLTEVDKWVLSQTDEEYKYHDWDELRQIIGKLFQLCLQLAR